MNYQQHNLTNTAPKNNTTSSFEVVPWWPVKKGC
jgi:hypothetical protein